MSEVILAGYSADKPLVAQQVSRGGKSVYIVSLPIHLVPVHLAIPDPSRPIDSNRAVSRVHAESFGAYWLKQPDSWTVPPLLVDTADSLEFKQDLAIHNGPKIGTLTIPDYSNQILRTLDGQHRILGWSIIRNKLLKELEGAQGALQQANRSGTDIEKQLAQEKLNGIRSNLSRMQTEQVTLEIITGVTEHEHKTFFVTIADNAQGINTSERTRLDETNMTSRVAKLLIDQVPLLTGRIEERKSAAAKSSKDLMSLANLRDVVRHTAFGIKGKVTMAREQQIDDNNACDILQKFFVAMIDAVPALQEIINGTSVPKTLRHDSLLGSVTIWRCLAGSYNDLAVEIVDNRRLEWDKAGHEKFVEMLKETSKKMKITSTAGSKKILGNWAETGCFNPGEASPRSRSQDLRNLSALFSAWAESGTVFQPKKIGK
jgi:hypothetical protein